MEAIWQNALRTMLVVILNAMSEHLRSFVIEGAYKFYHYAKTTETTDIDDRIAELLLAILGLSIPEDKS